MFGCCKLAAAEASIRKRWMNSWLEYWPKSNIFTATKPIQADLPGFVDDSHPAPGNLFQQFVVPETARRKRVAGSRLARARKIGPAVAVVSSKPVSNRQRGHTPAGASPPSG